ncbi:MAG: tol-pal system protein YbgF, partial [Magnetococcales bacterium]|nr:tol-pal system protein YbgF [Magnetococcales bacterium]
PVPVAQPAAPPTAPSVAATPKESAPPPSAKPATPAAAAAAKAPPAAGAKPAVAQPAATPQQVYDAAFALLKSGQYGASREGFENFLAKFPEDTLADNAQYWIGELYSVQKQYREALAAFGQVLTRWPTSAKVPPSLLKIGYAFYELGDMASARASLTKLVNDYPDSSAVSMARQRLQDIAQKEKESGKGGGGKEAAPEAKEESSSSAPPPQPPPESPGRKRIKRLAGE